MKVNLAIVFGLDFESLGLDTENLEGCFGPLDGEFRLIGDIEL